MGAETCARPAAVSLRQIFQPTPPVGAETRLRDKEDGGGQISTHSARGGGDPPASNRIVELFISTHSARGGGDVSSRSSCLSPFPISTHSARGGGDIPLRILPVCPGDISTHSARGGGDYQVIRLVALRDISTHSARGGGDGCRRRDRRSPHQFQPTPPVGAETLVLHVDTQGGTISTHSARGGGDSMAR